jgi:hypothetical protein
VDQAKPIAVGLSQEVLDISFGLMLVRTSRVSGQATVSDGTPSTSGTIQLIAEGSTARGQIGTRYGGRIQWDGRFTIGNVPPGRYVLQARSDDGEHPMFASMPVSVGGGDLTDVGVVLSPGAAITGTVTFPAASQPPDMSQVRIVAPALEQGLGGTPQSRVDKDGNFALDGIPAGLHFIRPQSQTRGWMLRSVTLNGRDITDTPLELRSGQRLAGVVVAFTDRVTQLSGVVSNTQGAAATEFTVLVFPTDTSLWRAQARQIMTARPDQTGKYTIRGLPPGSYHVAAVDPSEQGEWFEASYLEQQRPGASQITIGDGDNKTLDLRVR